MYRNIDDNGRAITARADHLCEWCGGTLAAGETCVYRKYIIEERFISSHMHMECWAAMNREIRDEDWGGDFEFYEHSMPRGMTIGEQDDVRWRTEGKEVRI